MQNLSDIIEHKVSDVLAMVEKFDDVGTGLSQLSIQKQICCLINVMFKHTLFDY